MFEKTKRRERVPPRRQSPTGSERSDVFLLGLAVHKGGKLATLDRRLPPEAVQGGTDALELITA